MYYEIKAIINENGSLKKVCICLPTEYTRSAIEDMYTLGAISVIAQELPEKSYSR